MATSTTTPIAENTDAILSTFREQMEAQMEELRPNYEAFLRLQTIVSNFDKVTTTATRKSRKGGISRAEEFLALVNEAGPEGISVAEASEKMGINQNYLYRIAKDHAEANTVLKGEDKRYRAA